MNRITKNIAGCLAVCFSLCVMSLVVSCSKKSVYPEPVETLQFSDYAFVDTSKTYLVRYIPPASQSIQLVGEMVMDW